jgi:amino acid adenylation domain-containing protein
MTCIHELFETEVERKPDAIAVVFEERSLTYRELNQRADDLAQHLRALGVGPDVLVALFLERSFDMVVGMLGVLKAGGAYVPLDPIHPQKRLAYMLADAQPLVLLTQARLQSELPPHNAQLVMIEDVASEATQLKNAPALAREPTHRDLAYVIYTSGSTGEPKGVAIEHRSVVNMLTSMQKRPGLGAEDTMLAITTLVFDIAVLEIFLPLTFGARVVIAGSEITKDSVALIDLIERSGVSVMQATPATLRMLLDTGWTGAPHLKILCGGEAWTDELASQLLPRSNSLWNMYGPTETTVWSSVSKVETGEPIVVGKPIARTRLYVLDGTRQLVPVGVPGELYIGGDGLARGYFNRPELTRERFVTDPFATEPGARMYRTGDLVQRRPDGTLDFLGRLDHQVKIRGFRIELGEIEARLRNYPGVAKAVVIVRDDQPGEKRLVAYFVGEVDISAVALRAHLATALPEYMVPTAYMRLEALPLTPNGKLDRKALPSTHVSEQASDIALLEPSTPTEKALARIWCEMLELKQVGLRDNFFDLGGHSLLAVRVIGDINKTLKGLLTIPAFYQDPTIEGLAKALEETRGASREAQLLSLQTGHTGLPLYFIGAGPHEVRLARHIGEDRPIFAIEAPIPLEWQSTIAAADRTAMPTIEDLGALYGDVLCAHAGSSPCVVVGYSFAGKIAFEAARSLQRAGGNVAFVLLIDAPAHVGEGHTGINFNRSLRWIRQSTVTGTENDVLYLNRVGARFGNYWCLLRWVCGRIPTMVKNHIEKVKKYLSPISRLSGYFDKDGVSIDETVMGRLHYLAGRAWKPRQLDASGVLFRVRFPGEDILPGYDLTKGWSGLFTQGLQVVQAAGDHMTMVGDENIVALTQQINAVLDQNEIVQNLAVARCDNEADDRLTATQLSEAYQMGGLA